MIYGYLRRYRLALSSGIYSGYLEVVCIFDAF